MHARKRRNATEVSHKRPSWFQVSWGPSEECALITVSIITVSKPICQGSLLTWDVWERQQLRKQATIFSVWCPHTNNEVFKSTDYKNLKWLQIEMICESSIVHHSLFYLFPGGSGGLATTPGVSGIPAWPPSEILPTELNIPPAVSKGPGEGRPGDAGTISIWDPWAEERILLPLLRCWVKRNFNVPPDLGA